MNIKDLKRHIPYQWRVQSFSQNFPTAQCVAYIDSRDVQNLLDEVCGEENWQDDYKVLDKKLIAGIGIYNENLAQWIWKWDTGTESNIEKEKGQMSDAFKRAAVKWGIGRFLYELPIKIVKTNAIKDSNQQQDPDKTYSKFPYVVDDSGKRVYDLTKHINSMK